MRSLLNNVPYVNLADNVMFNPSSHAQWPQNAFKTCYGPLGKNNVFSA